MEQLSGVPSSRGRGVQSALTNKRTADSRAAAFAWTIRKLIAVGFVSQRELANELNRSGIPTALGGSWHRTTVWRMLTRLGLITSGKGRINTGLAIKQAADVRAKVLASTIRAVRAKGLVSSKTIARELNEREIPTALGSKWHQTSVSRLLHRLGRLKPFSRTVVAADDWVCNSL